MGLTIDAIAKALAQANGHPDPDGYAARVKAFFDPEPIPEPVQAAEVAHEAIEEVRKEG